ncbi:hypothetical protein PSHT_00227 [Puccinia striiformis]|uniref:Uncharacterized protein n=1 Tax=Puccinia striiformis TaxID=27350 RepID=A0A2S4WNK4_9BASI|nr:hypothetical protein PSHT_00227 [Puccinia striiformis]
MPGSTMSFYRSVVLEFEALAESTKLAKPDASSSQAVVLKAGQSPAAHKSLHSEHTKHHI